jgi:quercetin dioxygenase-like cupin family protein
MLVNADFDQPATIHFDQVDWMASPSAGVDRKFLDRVGEEVARATSFVRYVPGSRFPSHTHDEGEEILVLDGVFSDEHADYPVGTYFRNPPGTAHAPGSETGCLLFVKLRQFPPEDTAALTVPIAEIGAQMMRSRAAQRRILYQSDWEIVSLSWFPPGARMVALHDAVSEYLVLNGFFRSESDIYRRFSWFRMPAKHKLEAIAGEQGCLAWGKVGPSAV